VLNANPAVVVPGRRNFEVINASRRLINLYILVKPISTHCRIIMVLDAFSAIDVLTVTTSKGTITKLTHSFVVTIGDIAPNEKVTIITVVRVNSTLTRTETVANVVTLTYGVSRSLTASVNYRVVYQALPPTGDLPLNWREAKFTPAGMIPGILLMRSEWFIIRQVWTKSAVKCDLDDCSWIPL
jgi:hypothetical protein